MTAKLSRSTWWTASIDDRAGGAADRLERCRRPGRTFEVRGFRAEPGATRQWAMLFVTPCGRA